MTDLILVFTTAGTREEGRKLAHALVDQRLAACVNIIPEVESIYRWKDQLETASEWMLMIKTTRAAFEDVCALIREMHSYDLAECIQVPIQGGSKRYLDWLAASVEVKAED